MPRPGSALPDFPWDSLAGAKTRAAAHPDGIVDLSVGTPVDPTPAVAQDALRAAANAPGYPQTVGTLALREAITGWFARRRRVPGLGVDAVLPTIGSKELVALLPTLLGLGPGDLVLHPATAYPTYDVGARLAGATPVPVGPDPAEWPDDVVGLVWLNSPGNPDGHVLSAAQLAAVVSWARDRGAVVAADECYAELPWAEPWTGTAVPSLLDPAVCGGSHERLLVLYSLSKQSNLAGYRAAFAAGDRALVGSLTEVRRHAGMMVPAPVQAAMVAALGDDAHVTAQRERYRSRRALLLDAVHAAGLRLDPESVAGLYLWVRAADGAATSWQLVDALAHRGILVAPGTFYGAQGEGYVRVALTATDERVAAAAGRLRDGGPLV
ncbi:succinyldiaminopimelate transaminase [Georgenia sp. TF02-10]|uniref:succinyldiaminopimelate transaminase n=1 Tax=Georgenia sp. TF02-10 TaxID=2917725 RepID=UPI001FA78FCD|nr:succinyldiaminopimelate transaminase [Georgenia sp. TF02-10]UNX55675.1 succinyldiaminopimelate transaminase [Georgenia sp. TF02-10]